MVARGPGRASQATPHCAPGLARLTDEHGAELSESTVRAFVAQARSELEGHTHKVTVPQAHVPGAEAEVDFGQFSAYVDGRLEPLWMFCMRLSFSGRGYHEAFGNQAVESFLEGHVNAFERFGGVPTGMVRYDNLKDAVVKVLLGRARLENDRFVALRSHYGFQSWYCRPGIEGSHEKGGVEGEIGRFRRNHLVPHAQGGQPGELNELFAAADAADDSRRIAWRDATVGEDFAAEAGRLCPLPEHPYDVATVLHPVVDTKARVVVRRAAYSVPASLARRRVEVRLRARHLDVFSGGRVVASHERALHRGDEHLVLDHYLEVLVHKPGALASSVPLAQARASGAFTAAHQAFWDLARRRRGDQAGTRALCMVLLLQRSLPAASVLAGISAAMAVGSADPEVVAVEARRHQDCQRPRPSTSPTRPTWPKCSRPKWTSATPAGAPGGWSKLVSPA